MARLRRVNASQPGYTRKRSGKGFTYLDERGERLTGLEVERVKALVIPPAWEDVWICRYGDGHLQAVGTDEAGRRQYLYHEEWTERRGKAKFRRVLDVAERMPTARRRVRHDLDQDGMPLERACATAFRLIDLGCFRVGGSASGEENGTYGLTTLERRHVHQRGDTMLFAFVGKSGVEHAIEVTDNDVLAALGTMRRRHGGKRLLAYRDGTTWRNLEAADVNEYLAGLFDGEFTAKDFRTWHATVRAACSLALTEEAGVSEASKKRAIREAAVTVADYLGNTPTVARSSYIDPRVIARYREGKTIDPKDAVGVGDGGRGQARAERAVRELLER